MAGEAERLRLSSFVDVTAPMFIKRFFFSSPRSFRPWILGLGDLVEQDRPLVATSALGGPSSALVRCNARVTHYFLWVANVPPNKIAQAALQSYCADVYARHVGFIGHGAFRRLFPQGTHFDRALRDAIAQFGSGAHRDVFAQMSALANATGSRALSTSASRRPKRWRL